MYINTPLNSTGGEFSLSLILENLDKKFYKILLTTKDFDSTEADTKNDYDSPICKYFRLFYIIRKIDPHIIHCHSPTARITFYADICAKIAC